MLVGLALAASIPAALPFAPPATPLHYRTTQTRPGPGPGPGGTILHFTMRKTLRFAAAPGGWRATLVMTAIDSDAPAGPRATFEAGMRPFLGVPVTVEVDHAGLAGAVVDGARAWARVTASFDAVLKDLARRKVPEAVRAQFAAYLAEVGKATPAARDARLRQGVADLLGSRMPALAPGQSAPFREQRLSPAGQPQSRDGMATLTEQAEDSRTYQLFAQGAPGIAETTTVTMSRTTGLLLSRRQVMRVSAAPDRQTQIVEQTRLFP